MSALKNEAFSLIEKIPDEYMYRLNEMIRDFISEKEIDNEEAKIARWQADPDKYENEISEYVAGFIKKIRSKKIERENADNS